MRPTTIVGRLNGQGETAGKFDLDTEQQNQCRDQKFASRNAEERGHRADCEARDNANGHLHRPLEQRPSSSNPSS